MFTMVSVIAVSGESRVLHTQNDNLRVSLPHLNAVVSPETLLFVCGHCQALFWNEVRVYFKVCVSVLRWINFLTCGE